MVKTGKVDKLTYKIYETRKEMGLRAAEEAAAEIKAQIAKKGEINMIFAAAPSQNEFLASLIADKEIDWTKVHAFHMDEYIGLDKDAPQGFGNFLYNAIFGKVPFASVNYIDITATDLMRKRKDMPLCLQSTPAILSVWASVKTVTLHLTIPT